MNKPGCTCCITCKKFRTILISDKKSEPSPVALPVLVLFCFTISHEHNWQSDILFIVTSEWFFFICSWFVKKLVVLFNKFFQTVKKRPIAVVKFKRGSEDYRKSSLCNWRRLILFILIIDVNTKLSVIKPIHARWLVRPPPKQTRSD